MKPETRLDSAVFQLTPTRTRYDLVIIANGKREKIASGLLNPFLAHLKTVHDQTAKGGYSIRLEPDPGTDLLWFTKGTVERFVRYVSSPEVLERVYMLELEILQIKEAIAIQGNDNCGLSNVEDHKRTGKGCFEGSKLVCDSDTEKAMVPYKDESNRRLSNGSIMQEDNSRIKLLRALDTRKTVLRKEQGMAFACAVAAGFDVDHVAHLISFAGSFGASRLLEACMRFLGLWQAKHKTEQWPEIFAEKVMSYQSRFSFMKASAAILAGDDTAKQKEIKEACLLYDDDVGMENHVKDGKNCVAELNSSHLSSHPNRDERSRSDPQVSLYPQYYHNQIENPMFLQFPSHSLPGLPMSQCYTLQGVPHYQNYAASGPSSQSLYPPVDHPSSSTSQQIGFKRSLMDNRHSNNESETRELGFSSARAQGDINHHAPWSDKEFSQDRTKQKSVGCSENGQSDVVVVQNRNYITSKGNDTSASDTEEEIQGAKADAPGREKNSSRSMKKNGGLTKSTKTSNTDEKQQSHYGQQEDAGNWQAFQNLLLRVQKENTSFVCRDMSTNEKVPPPKKRLNKSGADPTVLPERYIGDAEELRIDGFDMNSDFSSSLQNSEIYSNRTKNQHIYEPRDFSLMLDRGLDKGGFDPVKDFDMQNPVRNAIKKDVTLQENVSKSIRGLNKEKKSGAAKNGLEKQKKDAMIRKGKSPKSNLLAEAQDRAEKLRAFKADLQKAKKEKEEAEIKRLEILKIERQKRIAAKSCPTITQSSLNRQRTGVRKPIEFSASTYKGSNISDQVPTSSPKQKLPRSGTNVAQSLLLPQQTRAQKARLSPSPCRSAKFSYASPAPCSPLEKLPRSSTSISRPTMYQQQSPAQKTRLSPSPCRGAKFSDTLHAPSPLQKLPSSAHVSQLTMNAQRSSAQKPTRLSASYYKSSKFIDTLPASSSLQKLPTRITSVRSPNSHKITRLDGSTNLIRNESKCSIPAASEQEKESDSLVLHAKAAPVQSKRVFDPKVSSMYRTPSVRSVSSNQVPAKTILLEPQTKRTSATLHSDKTKSISLQENKIRTVKGPSGKAQGNSSTRETMHRAGSKASLNSESIRAKYTNKDALMLNINEDDVVDKAVVVLENETIPELVVQASIPFLPLPPTAKEVDDRGDCKLVKEPSSFEVVNHPKVDPPKFSNSPVTVKPCEAQHTGATPPGDPAIRNVEHVKEPMRSKNNKAHSSNSVSVNSSSRSEVHAMHEKSHNKESLNGLKDLLKFRRKGQSSASVPTLRSLMSQDNGTECTPPKGSHPFSLFSPFHTKNREKVTA